MINKNQETTKWFGIKVPKVSKERRNALMVTSVGTKFLLLLLNVIMLHEFIDPYDNDVYYLAIQNVFHGLWPWANNLMFYYPPLAFIPMVIAFVVAAIAGSPQIFAITMWILMSICDLITTFCVYQIGRRMYSERNAFIAAMLTATAFSSAHFVMSRFDAFPVCIAAISLMACVYSYKTKGYLWSIIGLFTKLWPIVIFPFLWVYNSRGNIIKEGKERAFKVIIACGILFGTMMLLGYNKFTGYIGTVYCNTIPFLISQYVEMMGISGSLGVIITAFRIVIVVVAIGALYWAYKKPGNITRVVKMIFIVIFVLVFAIQYRSAQYVLWFMPFLSLLLVGDTVGIVTFYAVQVLAYIEYPLIFPLIYTNEQYLSPVALPFFTVLFIGWGILAWRALQHSEEGLVPDIPEMEMRNDT